MYGSPAMRKDLNLPFALSPYKQGKEEAVLQRGHHLQMGSELLRYRSAPSSMLGEVCEELLPPRTSGPETESTSSRFAAPDPRDYLGEKQSSSASQGVGFGAPPAPHMFFQWHQPQQQEQDNHHHEHHQHQQQQQIPNLGGGGGSSSLLRHSSPLFANLNIENGFAGARGMGSGGPGFVSRQGSLVSQISDIGVESIDGGSPEGGEGRRFLSGYPVASWDDSVVPSNSFSKRIRDPSEVQNGEMRSHHMPSITHHLSLPKSSAEMAAMERFLQFQDAVPCKVRAKRGCATHPRSIAERVRRTRISERIKKLQELVPNMDKQTNTADMLDLAVDYIKDLQRQTKALSDSRANCSCSSRH